MTSWLTELKGDPLSWLLEQDPEHPGVRLLALRDILDMAADTADVQEAQEAAMSSGPVPAILAEQDAEGWWVKPGPGYYPKYRGTVWSLSYLAQLGASGHHPQLQKACDYVLANSIAPTGAFSLSGTAGMAIICLNGNLAASLLDLGWQDDPRLQGALEWMARAVTGQGIAPAEEASAALRYYKGGTCGPSFCCSANDGLPCAWGAVKVMLAFSKVQQHQRSPLIEEAIQVGIDFLLGSDPASADYPAGYSDKPSRSWFQFGFPVFYVTDVLQNLEALTALGCGSDPRLENALALLQDKADDQGRWKMEYSYAGKTWVDVEAKRKPSKWVTLRVLRALRRAGVASG